MLDDDVILDDQEKLSRIVVEQFSRHSAFSRPPFDEEDDDRLVPLLISVPLGILRELKEGHGL